MIISGADSVIFNMRLSLQFHCGLCYLNLRCSTFHGEQTAFIARRSIDVNLEQDLQKSEGKNHCTCSIPFAELLDCCLGLSPVTR